MCVMAEKDVLKHCINIVAISTTSILPSWQVLQLEKFQALQQRQADVHMDISMQAMRRTAETVGSLHAFLF